MSIIIQFAPGDKPGDSIVSSILRSPGVQTERGRMELNEEYTDRIIKVISLMQSTFILPKTLIGCSDRGEVHNERVTRITIGQSANPKGITSSCQMTTERSK